MSAAWFFANAASIVCAGGAVAQILTHPERAGWGWLLLMAALLHCTSETPTTKKEG